LLRKDDLQWDSSNAQALLGYCASQRYNISWELGNGKCKACLWARPAVTWKGTTAGGNFGGCGWQFWMF